MRGSTTKAIVQTGYGDASVLEPRLVELGAPGPDEVRIRHSAISVNFHDIYVRTGLYRTLAVPGIPGVDAIGEIVAVGSDVAGWRVGQRAAYIDRRYGAYCEERNVAASLLLVPPASLSDKIAVSSLNRALTTAMLVEQVYQVRRGDRVLVHAVAGTTGKLLAAWAHHIGARIVGTAGKRPVPPGIASLCDHIYSYAEDGWAERLLADHGPAFDYVCDSVGGPTFDASLNAAATLGHIALFGYSGGNVDQIAVSRLAAKSLTVTRPILFDYLAIASRRDAMMASVNAAVDAGALSFPEPICLPLDKAGEAQAMLEERRTEAPLVLIP